MSLENKESGIQASTPVRHENGDITWVVGGKVHTIKLKRLGAAAELPQVTDSEAETDKVT